MKTLFYVAIAINTVAFVAGYAANAARVLNDFHREFNFLLAALGAWILASLLLHRVGWSGLASVMAWFSAISMAAIAVVGVFLAGWIMQTFKGPGAFR